MQKVSRFFKILEIKFFKFVRWLGLIIATVAIVVSIILSLVAYSDYSTSVDDNIKNPEISFSKYKDELKEQKAAAANEVAIAEAEAQAARDKSNYVAPKKDVEDSLTIEFRKYYEAIYESLNKSQNIIDGNQIDKANFEYYLANLYEKYPDELKIVFMTKLKDASSDFLGYTQDIKKTNSNEYLSIVEFVEWYVEDFNQQVQQEQDRIEAEEQQASLNQVDAIESLPMIGVAFLTFLALVLVLVLLKIERNTRLEDVPNEPTK